jgi:ABC-2 type transport system permease protein
VINRPSHSGPATAHPTGRQTGPDELLDPHIPGKPHFHVTPGDAPRDVVAANSRTARAMTMAARRWLREVAVVSAWEVKTFLLRPTSYLLLLAAAALAGWSFSWLVTLLARGSDPALRPADDPISQFLGPNIFLIGTCTLLVPLLTMNAIADERRRATWELLLTAPLSRLTVVVGKFAALWCLFVVCLAPWFYHLAVLRCWNGRIRLLWSFIPWTDGAALPFDWGPVVSSAIGLAIIGATFVAVGLFCSALCRGAASAALLALGAMTTILALGFTPGLLVYWNFTPDQVRWTELVSCWGQIERFGRGVIEPRIILGHLSVCALLLWGTACAARRVDEGGRRTRVWRARGLTCLAFFAVIAALNGLAHACLPVQIDLTRGKTFTLATQTRNLLASLRVPVEVTILGPKIPKTAGEHHFHNAAALFIGLLETCRQAQPLLHFQELDPLESAAARQLVQEFSTVAPPCVLIRYGPAGSRSHEVLFARDLAEFRAGPDRRLAAVDFSGEQALAGALARLTGDSRRATIYATTGHGELALNDADADSRRGMGVLAVQLRDAGCELRPFDFAAAAHVPYDASLVLIAGGKVPWNEAGAESLAKYLRQGGKALVMAELNYDTRQQRVVPTGLEGLLSEFGVALGDDRVVTRGFTGQTQVGSPALPAAEDHPLVRALAPAPLTLYECRSLRTSTGLHGLPTKIVPLLVSHPAPRAWAEGDFGAARSWEPGGENDSDGPVPMAVAVERRQEGEPQPVLVVVGDAEFIANRVLEEPSGRISASFVISCVNWLRGRNELLGDIPPSRREGYRLSGTPDEQRGLVWKSSLVLWSLIATAGVTVWISRRRG